MDRTYSVVLVKEADGGYSVSVPALEGCFTQGDTVPEALWMAEDAMRLYLESLEAHGDPIPPDVSTVAFDFADAHEAMVFRVTVHAREAVPSA